MMSILLLFKIFEFCADVIIDSDRNQPLDCTKCYMITHSRNRANGKKRGNWKPRDIFKRMPAVLRAGKSFQTGVVTKRV